MPTPVNGCPQQHGGALLTAMLTLAVVTTFAATAFWKHWSQVESEILNRQRQQASWILAGALDWSRLVLREDARDNSVDHLGEPWALPLREARLSTFLAADHASADADGILEAFLSGRIVDLQSRLNFANVLEGPRISEPDLADFQRLFQILGLPPAELQQAVENYRFSVDFSTSNQSGTQAPPRPFHWEQLSSLGLRPSTLQALAPYATLLPERSKLNLNTASPEVLMASLSGLDAADAQQLIRHREQSHFKSTGDVIRILPSVAWQISDSRHSVSSRYFEVTGQLRLNDLIYAERSLVARNGSDVRPIWKIPFTASAAPAGP